MGVKLIRRVGVSSWTVANPDLSEERERERERE
eukprot:COSAG03_NODE_21606_length_302_cov_0.748768_1_plen_32_part_10